MTNYMVKSASGTGFALQIRQNPAPAVRPDFPKANPIQP